MKSVLVLSVAAGVALVVALLFMTTSSEPAADSTESPAVVGHLPIPPPAPRVATVATNGGDGGEGAQFRPHPDRAGFRRPSLKQDDSVRQVEKP